MMRRYFTLLLLTLCLSAASAQQNYKVGTENEKRGILVEEFTGSSCTNCPDGHRIAASIYKGLRGQAHVVCIHTGSFSPNSGFVLKTDDGDEIANNFKPQGFPSGMISRHAFSAGNYVYLREKWLNNSKKLSNDIATVNLYGEGTYDGSTRELKIHVEGYNVADNSGKDLRLHVMLTQDYIKGLQRGSMEGANYIHMHALRKCITPVKGDAVAEKAKGDFFTADYSYVLPNELRGQELKAENTNIIVFVTEDGMKEIANVKGFKPAYKNTGILPSAKIMSADIPVNNVYAFQFFEAKVRNMSEENMTNATFDVVVNGVAQEISAECDIKAFETGYVKIPCSYDFGDKNRINYSIALKRINDTDISPVSLSGSFERPQIVGDNIEVNIKTDKSADENDFTLKDMDGNIVMNFGPFEKGKTTTFNKKIKLEKGKTYCVEIIDYFGNGMENGNRGSLIVANNNDLVDYVDNIPGNGARVFFTIENDLAIDGVTMEEDVNGRAFSINGMVIGNNDKRERIVIRNGKKYLNR